MSGVRAALLVVAIAWNFGFGPSEAHGQTGVQDRLQATLLYTTETDQTVVAHVYFKKSDTAATVKEDKPHRPVVVALVSQLYRSPWEENGLVRRLSEPNRLRPARRFCER